MRFWQILFAAAVGLSCFTGTPWEAPRPLWAQPAGVSVTAAETIRRPAELLRMQIELSAQGKTLPEALKKLAARREAASTQLAKASTDQAGTRFGDTRIAVPTDRQRQIEMMVQQRMRQGGKKKKPPTEKPVAVSCPLFAEWKLQGKTAEELLIEAHGIEEKVRAADLAGQKAEEKTAEEQELAEEMGDQFADYSDGNEPKPGEPTFLYVGKISAEDRARALAAAFAKAREQAAELSKAAGAELGALESLSESTSLASGFGGGSMGGNFYNYAPSMVRRARLAAAGGEPESDFSEAVGPQPGDVALNVAVTAVFALAGK